MRVLLNAGGSGEPIGRGNLSLIRGLAFCGVRRDIKHPDSADLLIDEFDGSGLFPLFLVPDLNTAEAVVSSCKQSGRWPDAYAVQYLNEMNRFTTAGQYAQMFSQAESALRDIEPEVQLVMSGISSVTAANCGWLEEALTGASGKAIVAFHGYRRETQPSPFDAQVGFNSRSQEFADLRRMAAGRRLWGTEVGWHSAQRESGSCLWKKRWRLSDAEVAANLREEIKLNDAAGIEVLVIYQLNDGGTDTADDRYGIRAQDGSLKPSAHVLQEMQ